MSTLALSIPSPRLVSADVLKLRRRRGLVAVTGLLTVAAVVVTYAIIELLHVSSPATHGPAGGIVNLGHGAALVALLGAVAAAIVAATSAAGDLDALVYRDLVVTGRSRLALYLSRLSAGLLFLLPFVAAAYALTAVVSVVFAASNPMPSTSLLAAGGAWLVLQAAFYYLLGFGIASLLGSRSYSIGILLAFRLAVAPLLASISSLGIVRELVPVVGLNHLAPTGLGNSVWMGNPVVSISLGATAAVLVAWTAAALVLGARRDVTRDA
jgi:ABC-type transport system involved in multi-copper enzyme maturation permease subunit